MVNKIIGYFLRNRIISLFVLLAVIFGGLATMPFDWGTDDIIPRDPVAVDDNPDIGDNKQIVANEGMGH